MQLETKRPILSLVWQQPTSRRKWRFQDSFLKKLCRKEGGNYMEIIPVTSENRIDILNLSVSDSQKHFIETTKQCLEEADALSLWHPAGLYSNGILVGFAMYGLWKEEGAQGRVWLDRFFIDARYQGRGYGKAALNLLIQTISAAYCCSEIYLSLYDDNKPAMELYKKAGFQFNGELDINGERVMVKRF